MLNMSMNIYATVSHQLHVWVPVVITRYCWSPSMLLQLIIWFTEGKARTSKHTATFNLRVWRNLAPCHCADFHGASSPASSKDLLLMLPLSSPPALMRHWWVNSKRLWLQATKPWENSKKSWYIVHLAKYSCCFCEGVFNWNTLVINTLVLQIVSSQKSFNVLWEEWCFFS